MLIINIFVGLEANKTVSGFWEESGWRKGTKRGGWRLWNKSLKAGEENRDKGQWEL